MGLVAGAVHAIRVRLALFALLALPAGATVALVWPRTVALVSETAGRANRLVAVGARPAGPAHNVALVAARVVAVDVVARPAQLVALVAKVVCLTGDPIRVGERRKLGLVLVLGPFVFDREPVAHRVLDNVLRLVNSVAGVQLVARERNWQPRGRLVPSLEDERKVFLHETG